MKALVWTYHAANEGDGTTDKDQDTVMDLGKWWSSANEAKHGSVQNPRGKNRLRRLPAKEHGGRGVPRARGVRPAVSTGTLLCRH